MYVAFLSSYDIYYYSTAVTTLTETRNSSHERDAKTNPGILVADVLCGCWNVIRFRRTLFDEKAISWQKLQDLCNRIRLCDKQDSCSFEDG
jgi:hypothetical protein